MKLSVRGRIGRRHEKILGLWTVLKPRTKDDLCLVVNTGRKQSVLAMRGFRSGPIIELVKAY